MEDFFLPSWARYVGVVILSFGLFMVRNSRLTHSIGHRNVGILVALTGTAISSASFVSPTHLEPINNTEQALVEELDILSPLVQWHANRDAQLELLRADIRDLHALVTEKSQQLHADYATVTELYEAASASPERNDAYRLAHASYTAAYQEVESMRQQLTSKSEQYQNLAALEAPPEYTGITEGGRLVPSEQVATVSRGPRVIMYSTTWCGACKTAKRQLLHANISFEERLVDKSQSARQEYEGLGGRAVPLIAVDGKKVSEGLNMAALRRALGQ
ncbi:MAG: glutaredoxin family protein [Verrucomicrobiales bacterium]